MDYPILLRPDDGDAFRGLVRVLVAAGVSPSDVEFVASDAMQPMLLGRPRSVDELIEHFGEPQTVLRIDASFQSALPNVAAHRDSGRWALMYRMVHRMTHGERDLMKIATDDDVHQFYMLEKSVRRDIHKMKAFVRFRKMPIDDATEDHAEEHFVAFHRPDHRIVRLAGPFFARRFSAMRWTILTPDESVTWNGETLDYGPGTLVTGRTIKRGEGVIEVPTGDELEALWRTYYASIFNPARVKIKAMKAEMAVRHWPTLPESSLIDDLIHDSKKRVEDMVAKVEGGRETAAQYLHDSENQTLETLQTIAAACTACPLHADATQVVFGRGPHNASIVLVGEQPGDREDVAGEPFVGPAGQLLDDVLGRVGIDRDDVYITNVVKHFKFVQRGKRRIHQKPNSREIFACRPWLEAELDRVRPERLVCLGATAAQAILGRDFRITQSRGEAFESPWCDHTVATWHPAAVLRNPDDQRRTAMIDEMVADLTFA